MARYAEMFWDTFFAKVPEIMLFNSQQIMAGADFGRVDTNGSLAHLAAPIPQPDGSSYTPNNVARIAGYSAELLDGFLGRLGKPIGVATYKPAIPSARRICPITSAWSACPWIWCPIFPPTPPRSCSPPRRPTDKDLVAKIKTFVAGGGRVIATTGLMEALGDKGFQDIAEIHVTGHRVMAKNFGGGGRGGFGGGRGAGGT